jgi:hypothetical protein
MPEINEKNFPHPELRETLQKFQNAVEAKKQKSCERQMKKSLREADEFAKRAEKATRGRVIRPPYADN